MSSVEELYQRMGQQTGHPEIVVQSGDPMPNAGQKRYKLTKVAIEKALKKMPADAAMWSPQGLSEFDAKGAMKEALWNMVEKSVQTYAYAPNGTTLLEVK